MMYRCLNCKRLASCADGGKPVLACSCGSRRWVKAK